MTLQMESMESDHALPSINPSEVGLNSFQNKREYEASRNLIETRSENQHPYQKVKEINSIWDQDPVDFSLRLYHPKPPKRNSREAIKPWIYDKYLRPIDPDILQRNSESPKKSVEKVILNSFLSGESEKSDSTDADNLFQTSFRVLTPNGARIEASKSMGYRNSLEQFKNPGSFDHRGLKPLYGMPDFKTRFEKDPYNIKFLTNSLNQIHGLSSDSKLRDEAEGLQMGDLVKKADPRYDPDLILPRLPFPNKFHGYTRFRRRDRLVESAFWDRVLPKFNERINSQN